MTPKKPASHNIYNDPKFVKEYSENIKNNPWNAHYERPASFSLLPSLAGKAVLDAGCGSGLVANLFCEQGATVTGIDYSAEMLMLAKANTSGKCRLLEVDMNKGLGMFPDSEFDIVYSSLAIHYIDNLEGLFAEFSRVLKPHGVLVFSTDHPLIPDFVENPVVKKRLSKVPWTSYNIEMEIYERPWIEITKALTDSYLLIETILEPKPTEECKTLYPDKYEYLNATPNFVCVRCLNNK